MKVCPVCQRCFEDEILSCIEENHEPLIERRVENCEIIPNYRLEFLCESAAISETYRAVNLSLKEPCFFKIFAPELFDDEPASRELFLRETQDLSTIIHPNVVRVFERGMLADGSVYVVTEFFTEQTLRDCLEQKGVTEVNALKIAGQIAEGLNAIHSFGVLHGNIRPENIILTIDSAKIQNIDFGGIHQKIISSQKEENLSDFRYFSPEQCAGQPIDAQTDVYALGVVLYEMLSGQPPFDANEADDLISKQINENPPPIQINNFNIRALLTHTLSDSLQKTDELRLKSANIFARRLRYIEQIATHFSTPPPVMSYTRDEIPEEILADLPTDELPPIESVIGEFLSKNETEAEFTLIEWEQPDDIPLLTQIPEKEECAKPEFAFIDYDDSILDSGEIDSLCDYISQVAELQTVAQSNPGFFGNFPERRKIFTGAAVIILLTLAIGGTLLHQQFQIADEAEKTIAQSSPNEKSMTSERVIETPPQPEKLNTNDSPPVADIPEIPDYQPREIEEKKTAPILQNRQKNQTVRGTVKGCNCDKTIQNKPAANQVPERKVIVVTSDKKTANESKSAEVSIFNRPRIVKNPQF